MRALVIAVLVLVAGEAWADEDDRLAMIEASEPTVAEVVEAALRHAGLDEKPAGGWKMRARAAALLPWISLRAARDTSWEDRARQVGGVDHGVVLEARATWRLDRLVYDPSEIRATTVEQQRARAAAAVTERVTALYYKRRRAQIEALWQAGETSQETALRALAVDELTAQLDGLTGGWLARRLGRRR